MRSTTTVMLVCAVVLLLAGSAPAHEKLPGSGVGGAPLAFELRGDGADLDTGLLREPKVLEGDAGTGLSNLDGVDSSCALEESSETELRVAKPRPRAKPRK